MRGKQMKTIELVHNSAQYSTTYFTVQVKSLYKVKKKGYVAREMRRNVEGLANETSILNLFSMANLLY